MGEKIKHKENNLIEPKAGRVSINQPGCINVRSSRRPCAECIDSCPKNCVEMRDNLLVLDEAGCIECGVCVAICPSSVFALAGYGHYKLFSIFDKALGNSTGLEIGCEHTWADPGNQDGKIALKCLALLDESILFESVLNGAESIKLSAPCKKCEISTAEPLINRAVETAFEIAKMSGEECDITFTLTEKYETCDAGPPAEKSTRRDFFRHVGRSMATEMAQAYAEPSKTEIDNGRLKPVKLPAKRKEMNDQFRSLRNENVELTEAGSFYRIIKIGESCSVCYACSSYCPTGAITRRELPDAIQIDFDAGKCVKCIGCAQLCPDGAISYLERFDVDQVFSGVRTLFEQKQIVCDSCKKPFLPKGEEKRCDACRKFGKFQRSLMNSYLRSGQ